EYIGNREEIWYATNIEVYDYVQAYNQLVFSANGKKVYNPTAYDIYFEKDKKIYCVKPDECKILNMNY
ncbi:MAG: polysaccharide deacetylase, partial [Tyzzerella sp.]|nr:polysaccharide deacetylase [Tyzzerella sp.]